MDRVFNFLYECSWNNQSYQDSFIAEIMGTSKDGLKYIYSQIAEYVEYHEPLCKARWYPSGRVVFFEFDTFRSDRFIEKGGFKHLSTVIVPISSKLAEMEYLASLIVKQNAPNVMDIKEKVLRYLYDNRYASGNVNLADLLEDTGMDRQAISSFLYKLSEGNNKLITVHPNYVDVTIMQAGEYIYSLENSHLEAKLTSIGETYVENTYLRPLGGNTTVQNVTVNGKVKGDVQVGANNARVKKSYSKKENTIKNWILGVVGAILVGWILYKMGWN
jgi:VCBS repeat-containing protein